MKRADSTRCRRQDTKQDQTSLLECHAFPRRSLERCKMQQENSETIKLSFFFIIKFPTISETVLKKLQLNPHCT